MYTKDFFECVIATIRSVENDFDTLLRRSLRFREFEKVFGEAVFCSDDELQRPSICVVGGWRRRGDCKGESLQLVLQDRTMNGHEDVLTRLLDPQDMSTRDQPR
jgi:hypothetical protein